MPVSTCTPLGHRLLPPVTHCPSPAPTHSLHVKAPVARRNQRASGTVHKPSGTVAQSLTPAAPQSVKRTPGKLDCIKTYTTQ